MDIQLTLPDVAVLSLGSYEHGDPGAELRLIEALITAGFHVLVCTRLSELFTALRPERQHMVVIDTVETRDLDGFMLASNLHSTFHVGILLLVGPSQADRARGRDCGADICLSMPVQASEVVEALLALHRKMRRPATAFPAPPLPMASSPPPESATWIFDKKTRRLRAPNGYAISLNKAEGALVRYLFEDEEKLARRDRWNEVFPGRKHDDGTQIRSSIDMTVCRMRQKLRAMHMDFPIQIKRGVGYYFSGQCRIEDAS